jgi:hypothetical protein
MFTKVKYTGVCNWIKQRTMWFSGLGMPQNRKAKEWDEFYVSNEELKWYFHNYKDSLEIVDDAFIVSRKANNIARISVIVSICTLIVTIIFNISNQK